MTRSALAVALAVVVAACDAVTPAEQAAGTYTVETFAVSEAGTTRDLVAEGLRFAVVLGGDGRYASDLTGPRVDGAASRYEERVRGPYRLLGPRVAFDSTFGSTVLDLDWELEGDVLRTVGTGPAGPAIVLRRR